MKEYKYSVGIWAYGGCGDRFNPEGYQSSRTFREKLELAVKTEGVDGVEIHYNGDFGDHDAKEAKKMIDDSGLVVAAMNCETFGDKDFGTGALTNPKASTRAKAVDIVKKGCDAADFFGSTIVNLWPGADGFDIPFQVDYDRMWDYMYESVEDIAVHAGKTKVSLEYKFREPRMRSTLSTVGKTLLLAKDLNRENIGVTLDFGHSLQCKENPAEALCLLNRYGKLFHVHLNDNTRDWDDDLMVGSYHLWETLEFVSWIKRSGYDGWIGLDMSPAREDQVGAVAQGISLTKKMFNITDRIDESALNEARKNVDALSAQKIILSEMLK